jgi:predicted  nucleic acid-binding Zn-ribbon protein
MSNKYLEEECSELRVTSAKLNAEKQALLEKLSSAELKYESLSHQVSRFGEESKLQMDAANSALQEKLADAQCKIKELEDRLESEAASNKHFEDYKKRAQLALKTANQSASSATSELSKLKILLDESEAKAVESDRRAQKMEADYEEQLTAFKKALEDADSFKLRLSCELDEANNDREATQVASNALRKELASVKTQLAALSAEAANKIQLPVVKLPQTHKQVRNSDSAVTLSSSDGDTEDSWVEVHDTDMSLQRKLAVQASVRPSSRTVKTSGWNSNENSVGTSANNSANASPHNLLHEVGVRGYGAMLHDPTISPSMLGVPGLEDDPDSGSKYQKTSGASDSTGSSSEFDGSNEKSLLVNQVTKYYFVDD